jgi:hypothetical protein
VVGPIDTLVVAGGSGMDEAVAIRAGRDQAPRCRRPSGHVGLFRRIPARGGRPLRAVARPLTGPIAVSWRPTSPRSRWIPTPSSSRTQRLDLGRRDRLSPTWPSRCRRRPRTASRGHRCAPLVVYLQRSGVRRTPPWPGRLPTPNRYATCPGCATTSMKISCRRCPSGQPVGTTVHASLRSGGRHRGGPRRGRPPRIRLSTPGEHQQDHRADRQNLRLRNT